jgi:hypothetical protein
LKHSRLLIILSLTGLIIMGCSLPGIVINYINAPTPTETLEITSQEEPTRMPTQVLKDTFQGGNAPEPTEEPEELPKVETQPTPTPDPLEAQKTCLFNTWEITGISDYVLSAIPSDLVDQYDLEYTGTSGGAFFTLSSDGNFTMRAEQLEILFNARVSILTVPVTARVDGEATGTFIMGGDTLTILDMDTSGLTASAKALGQDLLDPAMIINAIPLIRAPYNSAEYSCAGDTLQLKISAYPESIPPLVFHKVK